MNSSVSIATKPLVYSAFRYISNKVHNAIAEYVDNSIQSFTDHKELLTQINPSGTLSVRINIDTDHDVITIKDDAFGISDKYYERAFELANIPLDASGLNEFGMGMKVSSIWLSNLWTVETSAYGEPYKKTLEFDLDEVVANEKLDLDVKIEPATKDSHYTIITLKKLSQNKPSGRQITGIKKHLTSIYSKYIRDKVLDLYINDELQCIEELRILNEPYFETPKADPIYWKKEINWEAGKYKVKGFIGLLEKMSTSTDNGFLLFRRGRVIGTSYEDRYRPKCLCGEVGSPRYKRIFGELELEGFNVSFTKNSFTEGDDFEMFINLLAEELEKDTSFRIFRQGQHYKKIVEVATPKVAKSLTSTLASTFTKPIVTQKDKPIVTKSIEPISNPKEKEENLLINNVENFIPLDSPETTVISMDGYDFKLEIGHVKGPDPGWFYDLSKIGENQFRTQFNLSHKYFGRFAQDFNSEDGYLPVATLIKAMVSTELSLLNDGSMSGNEFRNKFNSLIGQI